MDEVLQCCSGDRTWFAELHHKFMAALAVPAAKHASLPPSGTPDNKSDADSGKGAQQVWYPSFWYKQVTGEFHPGGAEIAIKALKRAGTQGKVLCRKPTAIYKFWQFELESVCACAEFLPFAQSIIEGHESQWPVNPKGKSSDEDPS